MLIMLGGWAIFNSSKPRVPSLSVFYSVFVFWVFSLPCLNFLIFVWNFFLKGRSKSHLTIGFLPKRSKFTKSIRSFLPLGSASDPMHPWENLKTMIGVRNFRFIVTANLWFISVLFGFKFDLSFPLLLTKFWKFTFYICLFPGESETRLSWAM